MSFSGWSAPWAGPDAYSVVHDQTLTTYFEQGPYGTLYNDFDMDGDQVFVSAVNGNGNVVGVPFQLPSGGTLTMNADGTFAYTPPAAYVGQDGFTYTVEDGKGGTATATVTVVVGDPSNRAPVAVDDAADVPISSGLYIEVLANDSDPDGDQLAVISFTPGEAAAPLPRWTPNRAVTHVTRAVHRSQRVFRNRCYLPSRRDCDLLPHLNGVVPCLPTPAGARPRRQLVVPPTDARTNRRSSADRPPWWRSESPFPHCR